jgi:hypothetical protein
VVVSEQTLHTKVLAQVDLVVVLHLLQLVQGPQLLEPQVKDLLVELVLVLIPRLEVEVVVQEQLDQMLLLEMRVQVAQECLRLSQVSLLLGLVAVAAAQAKAGMLLAELQVVEMELQLTQQLVMEHPTLVVVEVLLATGQVLQFLELQAVLVDLG